MQLVHQDIMGNNVLTSVCVKMEASVTVWLASAPVHLDTQELPVS